MVHYSLTEIAAEIPRDCFDPNSRILSNYGNSDDASLGSDDLERIGYASTVAKSRIRRRLRLVKVAIIPRRREAVNYENRDVPTLSSAIFEGRFAVADHVACLFARSEEKRRFEENVEVS